MDGAVVSDCCASLLATDRVQYRGQESEQYAGSTIQLVHHCGPTGDSKHQHTASDRGSIGSSIRFDALLRAHGFMKVERPPEIWAAATEDVAFIPLLGEMIAAALAGGLARGLALADLTLNVSNVVVERSPDEQDADPPWVAPGEYVAITVSGATDLGPDSVWRAGHAAVATRSARAIGLTSEDGGRALRLCAPLPERASITVFLDRET